MSHRPRGIRVYPMPEEVSGPRGASYPHALLIRDSVETPGIGVLEVRMVNTEGVSYEVTDEKPWCWTDRMPARRWTKDELLDIVFRMQAKATHGFVPSSVDLADWVRTFGSRLEANFAQNYYWACEGDNNAARRD